MITSNLLERATQLINLRRFTDAEVQLRDVLSFEPNNALAISLLALCKSEIGQHAEAIQLIRQAISQEPDNSYFLYLHSLFLFRNENLKEAEKFISNAIAYDPNNADYFGLIATIKIEQKEWNAALLYANQGLSVDSENLTCLNVRSTALLKLDRKEESFETIREALSYNPENDHTHANVGWGLLERGDHVKALESFKEALRLNPENEYAKSGMMEALKARYLVYRIFLKYAFWVGNMKAKGQWIIILGLYFGVKILRMVADANENLAVFIKPVIYLYFAFALSTWLIDPLSNLFLRLNMYGRYALKREQIKSSNYVGIALAMALFTITLYFIYDFEFYFLLTIYFTAISIPLASMFNPKQPGKRKILVAYTIALLLVGALSILMMGSSETGLTLWYVFIFGIVAYQWIANALVIR
ncbi:MAG: tetratricopeptide repeat protein [Cyclobacteriaceae bacterium]|nr:tetratricopeptide repeat protein [Cyclobacteriaceae bacterium]